jgi:hypothetical protein
MNMLTISLLLNILVLIPICYLMLTNNFRIVEILGVFNPARGILLSLAMCSLLWYIFGRFIPLDKNKFLGLTKNIET